MTNKYIFFGIAVCIFTLIVINVFFSFKVVVSDSMLPNIKAYSIVVGQNLFFSVKENDIYCFKNENKLYLKRAVTVGRSTVEIIKGNIYIDNIQYRPNYNFYESVNANCKYTLNDNQTFFLGDNRVSSYDSKDFGPIDNKNIKFKLVTQFSIESLIFLNMSLLQNLCSPA